MNGSGNQMIKKNNEEIKNMNRSGQYYDDCIDETECFLGTNSEFFRFEKAPCHIELCSASVKNNNVDEIIEFVEKHY
ncbi:hypothetical protein PFUGPA_01891 [Plasmodium falciparum Palo Alto/Uganda]|uniref:Uncharacterized protein n=1 Tax=Plasmodium falciparum (isolate Palo Alto / Uganda) TaxID=57270 RepID=W4J1D8_PLAFP|nr:hypothetical protein PFUGPA_01891 [Plasmodium falciparum Palo Alto/Uganda]